MMHHRCVFAEAAAHRLALGHVLGICVLLAAVAGCGSGGQPSGRPDIDAIPEIELRGSATKASIYEFRAKVKRRGVNAAKAEVPLLLESLEGYEKLKLGEHTATYQQIVEKLKALQGTLASSPSKDAVTKAADEIAALADKLPGKADPNPQVE
jgi:hypothetical protein